MTPALGRRMSAPAALVLGCLLLWGVRGLVCDPEIAEAVPLPEQLQPRPAWPMFGGTIARNLANPSEKGIPDDFCVKKGKERNIKWVARLGSKSYATPVIAGGKIFVGANNEAPRDPAIKGDKGILMCFRESDGKFLWQAVHDLPDNPCRCYPRQGVASSPVVDGDRLYYVSHRGELVCADVEGDQATGKAKFIWKLDMVKDLGVFPCLVSICSPLLLDGLVFAITGNGVDDSTRRIPAPDAPSFIAVDKKTGKVVWKDNSPGKNIVEGQWSNPCAADIDGQKQVIFPGGDGWLRAFEPKTGKLLWKFNCNPSNEVFKPGDKNYFIATPVVHDKKVYIGVGQNPGYGDGVGHLWCIDISKKPANKELDLSPVNDNFDPRAAVNKDSGLVWHYGGKAKPPLPGKEDRDFIFGRTISTVAVVDDLVYAAELDGYLHCLDAKTGTKYWKYDLQDSTWNSPYYVDGKVFLGTDSGDMYIFSHGKQLKPPKKIA